MFTTDLHDSLDSRAFNVSNKAAQFAAYEDADRRHREVWAELQRSKTNNAV